MIRRDLARPEGTAVVARFCFRRRRLKHQGARLDLTLPGFSMEYPPDRRARNSGQVMRDRENPFFYRTPEIESRLGLDERSPSRTDGPMRQARFMIPFFVAEECVARLERIQQQDIFADLDRRNADVSITAIRAGSSRQGILES